MRPLTVAEQSRLRKASAKKHVRKCHQCGKKIVLANGKRLCERCKKFYGDWKSKTDREKVLSISKARIDPAPTYQVVWVPESGNRKLGPIPTSLVERSTCPPACSFYEAGCYADYHLLRYHWKNVPEKGISWPSFLFAVSGLPKGTLWRHATAGDLPGQGNLVDHRKLQELVRANFGKNGFTFTHKPVLNRASACDNRLTISLADDQCSANRLYILLANQQGFTVNLSADTLEDADAYANLRIGPVVVILPHDHPSHASRTPEGRKVVVCPAQTTEGMTCQKCRLCAKPNRKCVVGFRAHGQAKKLIPEIVRHKRKVQAL